MTWLIVSFIVASLTFQVIEIAVIRLLKRRIKSNEETCLRCGHHRSAHWDSRDWALEERGCVTSMIVKPCEYGCKTFVGLAR